MNNHLNPANDALYKELAEASKSLLKGAVRGYLGEEFTARRARIESLVARIAAAEPMTTAERVRLQMAACPKSVSKGAFTRRANQRCARNEAFQQRVMADGWPKSRKAPWQKTLMDILAPGVMCNGGRRSYGDHSDHCAVTYERHMTAAEKFYASLERRHETRRGALAHFRKMFGEWGADNSETILGKAKDLRSYARQTPDEGTRQWALQRAQAAEDMVAKWRAGLKNSARVAAAREKADAIERYKDGWHEAHHELDMAVMTAGYAAIGKTEDLKPVSHFQDRAVAAA